MEIEGQERYWLTVQGYKKVVALEAQIHHLMTEKLGWVGCPELDDQNSRLWNFLDYLEETYVRPTYTPDPPLKPSKCSSSH